MGIIFGALGGLGKGLSDVAEQNARQYGQEELQAKQAEIQAKRDAALADMQDKREIAKEKRIIETRAAQGEAISNEADQLRLKRIADNINLKEGSSMTAEDAKAIASNPEAIKAYGLRDRTRAEEYDDKASIAERKGLLDHAKDFRSQQGLELQRDSESRRDAEGNRRHDESMRRMDIQDEFNRERAKNQDRLASIAEARANRMEGRASEQMGKAELQSTRQSLLGVLKDIGTQQDRLQLQKSNSIDADEKKILAQQVKELETDRTMTKNELLKLAGVAPVIADRSQTAAPPDGTRGMVAGVSGVVKDGKFVPDGSPQVVKKEIVKPAGILNTYETNRPENSIEQIQSSNVDTLRPLADKVSNAQKQLAAVAKSGDSQSLTRYAKEFQSLKDQLEATAEAKFGNGAPAILKKLGY
jgi:hypothetical protein